jgi:hypothetical protein
MDCTPASAKAAGDRAARAAGAEQRHAPSGEPLALFLRAVNEAHAVEHVARPRAVAFPAQRIQRADGLRGAPQTVGEGQHPRLERHRGNQAVDVAKSEQRRNDRVEALRRHMHGNANRGNARRREPRAEDFRRAHLRDRIADDRIEARGALDADDGAHRVIFRDSCHWATRGVR